MITANNNIHKRNSKKLRPSFKYFMLLLKYQFISHRMWFVFPLLGEKLLVILSIDKIVGNVLTCPNQKTKFLSTGLQNLQNFVPNFKKFCKEYCSSRWRLYPFWLKKPSHALILAIDFLKSSSVRVRDSDKWWNKWWSEDKYKFESIMAFVLSANKSFKTCCRGL